MEIKQLGATIKDATDAGSFEAILSMPTVDRDGEVLDARSFEPLPDHIPIDIDHGMSVTTTVGSGTPYYDGDVLMFRGTFASTPLGQEVRTLVREGHVRKMSVAFMGSEYEDGQDGVKHLRKGELLNAAIVAIPSNRQADILAAKSVEVEVAKAADGVASAQQLHDRSIAAGATCAHGSQTSTEQTPKNAPAPVPARLPADAQVAKARAAALAAEAALLP